MKMKEGIFDNISIGDYHGDTGFFSATSLKLAKKSLKLFKLYLDGKVDSRGSIIKERKMFFDFGNAFELALLDRNSFEQCVSIYNPDQRPDKNKSITSTFNQDWKKEIFNSGKYVINSCGNESFSVITEMLASCYQDAVIQKLIQNIEYQYSMFWTDKETGLKLKTRPDVCKSRKNVIVDVKTTNDGSPEKFSKDLANYDYPFQAVMQIDGVLQSGFMKQVDAYYWLVVEKQPPYSATLYEFDPDDRAWVTDEYEHTLRCVSESFKKGLFPSYSNRADNKYGILRANIPLWYKNYGL